MRKPKRKFVFNLDWADVLMGCQPEVRLEVYDAIVSYAASGVLPDLKPMARLAFAFIKPELDSILRKASETSEKRRQAVKSRWRHATTLTPVAAAHPPDPPDLETEINTTIGDFFSKQIQLEQFCASNRTTVGELRRLADEVKNEWILTNEKDISAKHLTNAIRLKINRKYETRYNTGKGLQSRMPKTPGCGLIED